MNGLDANLIIANAPDPVFVSDLQGKILDANDAVSALLGFRKDEVLEQSLSRFISIEETREFMAALREVGARGVTRNARLNPRSASGEIIPTTLNASALRDPDGTVIGAIGILRDMRAYEIVVRDLEESRRRLDDANRAKDEFLATLSHELRTPLNAILGWVRLLRSGTLDPASAHRGPEIIERNTRVLAQLIEELLDVSRIITGKLRLDVRSVNLVSVVVAAMEAVQAAADAKGILLATNLDPYLGPVSADPDRLQQVVWNLLTNAIKFTPTGGRVDIRLERADSLARITVSDTGKGIRPDLLPFVFDRFRQEETSIGRGHGGLGLGLGLDSCGCRCPRQRTKQSDQRFQRPHADARFVDEHQARTLLARRHPFRQEGPRAIGQQTPQGALTVWRPLDALDGQLLADKGVPAIVDDDGTL